ncbi:hypothetical protein ACM64Y_15145 [Novispirillum sp. DQ9]|uniref:hypothetical protein n=1 Tax=Novispirillum sp. DQ9 TaxID=3398612 RepID=UPI003C7D669C
MMKRALPLFVAAALVAGAIALPAPAEARCVENRSNARVKVDIHAIWINRIQDWLEPHESRCFTYNFLADIRLDAIDTPEFGTVVSGNATHSFTTNQTRITVTEKRRYESNGVKYVELDFCRDC